MPTATFGWTKTLQTTDFDGALAEVKAALKAHGFGVLTEIDVQAKFQDKLGVSFGRYRILGACNPALAHEALQEEPLLGLLLPCNVIVYEDDAGAVQMAITRPDALVQMVPSPALARLADKAGELLQGALDDLG